MVRIVRHPALYMDIQGNINDGVLRYGTFGRPRVFSIMGTRDGDSANALVTRTLKRETWAIESVLIALGVRVPKETSRFHFKWDGARWTAVEVQ